MERDLANHELMVLHKSPINSKFKLRVDITIKSKTAHFFNVVSNKNKKILSAK